VPACTTRVRWSVSTGISCTGEQGTYAQDTLGADQLDEAVLHGADRVALGVGLEVAQVADVALLVGGRAVRLAEGVDCGRQYIYTYIYI